MKRVVLVSLVVQALLAVPLLGDPAQIVLNRGPGQNPGGAFIATVVSGSITLGPSMQTYNVGDSWQSFCAEYNENFGWNTPYYVNVNTAAVLGGLGGPSPDPLSAESATVYRHWLAGPQTGDALANKYQLAIWSQEQEVEYKNNTWVKYGTTTALAAHYQTITDTDVSNLIASVGTPTIGNTRVLNLYTDWSAAAGFSGARQDQLIHFVPVPGAALLGLLGLGAAGLKLRRRF
jgi:hypothetical protein